MKKILSSARSYEMSKNKARLFDFGIVFAVTLLVLGCNFSSSGLKNNRNRRNSATRSTPTPAQATTAAPAAADSRLTTALVTQTARFVQAADLDDKPAMAQLMADDFSYYMVNSAGSLNKQEFIEWIEEEPDFVSVTIKNARITDSDSSTATLEYLRVEEFTKRTESANCRSPFVKSGANWLIQSYNCSETVIGNK